MTPFENFYIRWYARAKSFAIEYVGSENDAENVVQDVFLHLYERWEPVDSHLNLTAYFFTSVKNRCLDHLRKQLAEREALSEMQSEFDYALQMKHDSLEILHTDFPNEPGIEERIRQALQTLPERCRQIFVLNKLHGKKQRHIAEELHLSIHTVESQMAIAYRKLREELKDCMPLLAFLTHFF